MTTSHYGEQAGNPESRTSTGHPGQLDLVACDLVKNGSIELTSGNCDRLPVASELLPWGMSVYVPMHRQQSLADSLRVMESLRDRGFNPVPHLPARLITSRQDLKDFLLTAVGECGVHRLLLVGGDETEAQGPYPDSTSLLQDGIIAETGIQEIGIAGYPEGHPRISPRVLQSKFDAKLQLASAQGLGIDVVTQFSFAPSRIVEYCSTLGRTAPDLNLYVGLAGPTHTARLLQFAQQCGVSASLRALGDMGIKTAIRSSHTNPDEQLEVLARHCALIDNPNVIGVHLFSFGGFLESARWMRSKCRLH
jgi:methylenetetrahydrofolate reductase (NADPH)